MAEELRISFAGEPDGGVPARTPQGYPLGVTGAPGGIHGGRFESLLADGRGATYLEADTGWPRISVLGATFRFQGRGTDIRRSTSSLCLASWADGGQVARGRGRRTSAHIVIAPTCLHFHVREVADTFPVQEIATRDLERPLRDGVAYDIECELAPGRIIVRVDGRRYELDDARIAEREGESFACWEPFYLNAETDARVSVETIWARA